MRDPDLVEDLPHSGIERLRPLRLGLEERAGDPGAGGPEGEGAGGIEAVLDAAGGADLEAEPLELEDGGGGGDAPVPEALAEVALTLAGAERLDADPGGAAGA